MTALSIDHISKSFGGVDAVADISMQVPAGRITGLIGPNGAGKTTLINLITGILTVSKGNIRFGEQDITQAPAHMVARAGITRTFQNIRLLTEASVIDNVMIGFYRRERSSTLASLLGLPAARKETVSLRARALALLELFGMAHLAEHEAGGLAYGHQRRVEMMRALASEPALILLDEPVAGVNPTRIREIEAAIRVLRDAGETFLVVEHNMEFIMNLCDHVVVFDQGVILTQGSPREVHADARVLEAYLGVRT